MRNVKDMAQRETAKLIQDAQFRLKDLETKEYSAASSLATLTGTQTLTNKTLTNPLFNTTIRLTRVTHTIATGAITVSSSWVMLDTEGAAGTDDLDTINGGTDGMIIIVSSSSPSRDPTIKNGTGNIACGTDFVLTSNLDACILAYQSGAAKWLMIARSDNA